MDPHIRRALIIVWAMLSIAAAALLLCPWFASETDLLALSAGLQTPHDEPCVLCGMTRAWLAIYRGEFELAQSYNRLSLPLMITLLINEFAAAWCLLPRRSPSRGAADQMSELHA